MPSIKVHHTDTSEGSWDGPANKARLQNDESESYYRKAFAWQDPDGDPETKAAYKFIHHEVSGDRDIGAANVRGCITGIAVLNGARGGADIPDGDRRGVWQHLAAHLEDADVEPPELRARPLSGPERRNFPLQEMRLEGEDGQRRIVGHAAVFNVLSEPLWGFRERIKPGAFSRTIQESDVRALWNHNNNYVLGRSKAGTLRLEEDDRGLGIEILPPDTQWARDFMVSIDRGDVDQMSFSFRPEHEEWTTEDGEPVRTLVEVELHDVSPVTFPAYPQTSVYLRSIFGMEIRDVEGALSRLASGAMTDADRRLLEDLIERIEGRLTAAPPEGGGPADPDDDGQLRAHLDHIRIELAKRKL